MLITIVIYIVLSILVGLYMREKIFTENTKEDIFMVAGCVVFSPVIFCIYVYFKIVETIKK